MRRRPGLVASLLLAVAFAIGGLTGMVLEEALGIDWFDFLDEDARSGETRLLADLNLSASQRERVESILDDQEDRLEEYWDGRMPELRAIVDQTYDEIRVVLTPQQQAAFDERVRAQRARVPESMRD